MRTLLTSLSFISKDVNLIFLRKKSEDERYIIIIVADETGHHKISSPSMGKLAKNKLKLRRVSAKAKLGN